MMMNQMAIKTVRSIPWRGKKPEKILRGRPLSYNAAVADRYNQQLYWLVAKMAKETQLAIVKLFKEPGTVKFFANDAGVSSQAKALMRELQNRFDDLFGFKAKRIAEEFSKQSTNSSAAQLQISLRELSQGLILKTDIFTGELNEVLSANIAENVALIKSIPEQYLGGVQGAVMHSITTGRGLADLVPFLEKHKEITVKRARLIAHDQTRKAFSATNRVRLERLGVKKFEWLHSAGGQVPREQHVHMSGNIYDFDDPPVIDDKTGERGYPGQLINCRCRMIPVIDFDTD